MQALQRHTSPRPGQGERPPGTSSPSLTPASLEQGPWVAASEPCCGGDRGHPATRVLRSFTTSLGLSLTTTWRAAPTCPHQPCAVAREAPVTVGRGASPWGQQQLGLARPILRPPGRDRAGLAAVSESLPAAPVDPQGPVTPVSPGAVIEEAGHGQPRV